MRYYYYYYVCVYCIPIRTMITALYCSMEIYNNKRRFLNDPLKHKIPVYDPQRYVFLYMHIRVHYY